jgi:hypothetical protein
LSIRAARLRVGAAVGAGLVDDAVALGDSVAETDGLPAVVTVEPGLAVGVPPHDVPSMATTATTAIRTRPNAWSPLRVLSMPPAAARPGRAFRLQSCEPT